MKVELIKITKEILQQCFELKVANDQVQYIAPNSDSWNAAKQNENVARPFAIYSDGEMVGFHDTGEMNDEEIVLQLDL